MVWYAGRGYVIHNHHSLSRSVGDEGRHRAARAAKKRELPPPTPSSVQNQCRCYVVSPQKMSAPVNTVRDELVSQTPQPTRIYDGYMIPNMFRIEKQ